MKKFKTKTLKNSHNEILILLIICTVIMFFNYYNKKISPKILNIASTKIEEITNLYIKNNIVPEYVDL